MKAYDVFPCVYHPIGDIRPVAKATRPHVAAKELRLYFARKGSPVPIYGLEIVFRDNAYFLPERFRLE